MIDLGLEGKKAIIIGASKGIGEKVSYALAEQGCSVTLVARNSKLLRNIVANLNKINSGNNYLAINLLPKGNPTKVIKKIFKNYGTHQIIVNCVGGGLGIKNPPTKIDDWKKVWRFNCGIALEINMTALDHLKNSNYARFIHISSYASKLAKPSHNKIAYSASKAYLNSYIKNMSKVYGNKNIIFNGIMPGPIATKNKYWHKELKKNSKKVKKYLTNNFSMKRFAKYEEIIPYILTLASEFSTYTSGSIIDLSGGEIE